MSSTEKQKKTYDTIYQEVENYNFRDPVKDDYVDKFAELMGKDKSFVDLGCGEGANVRRLMGLGYNNIECVEISQVCCENFLADLPYYNSDIVSFAKLEKKYDAVICMDVLEHISISEVSDVISSISNISSNAFLGIANHSDIINGVELHLIQKDSSWWQLELLKYFTHVILISEIQQGSGQNIFFMFFCSNGVQDVTNLNRYFYKEIIQSLKADRSLVNNTNINLRSEVSKVNEAFLSETSKLQDEISGINKININLQGEVRRVNKVFESEVSRLNKVFDNETSRLNEANTNLQNEISRIAGANTSLQAEISRITETNINLQNDIAGVNVLNKSLQENLLKINEAKISNKIKKACRKIKNIFK